MDLACATMRGIGSALPVQQCSLGDRGAPLPEFAGARQGEGAAFQAVRDGDELAAGAPRQSPDP